MNLAVGIIVSHGFPAPTEFWDSYEQVMHHLRSGAANAVLPPEMQIDHVRRIKSTKFPTDVARNEIVRGFLDEGDEAYLVFMDADMVFPPDWVTRALVHQQPVVTGRYHQRRSPYHAVAYVKHRLDTARHHFAPIHYGRGLIEIERAGAGALVIHRSVLQAIRFRIGDNWFRYQRVAEEPFDYDVSEDFWFFQQAREAGFRCYVDWDIECGHLKEVPITGAWNNVELTRMVREITNPDMPDDERERLRAALIVCGFPDGLTLRGDEHSVPVHVPEYQITAGER
jgi:hypothetical protein